MKKLIIPFVFATLLGFVFSGCAGSKKVAYFQNADSVELENSAGEFRGRRGLQLLRKGRLVENAGSCHGRCDDRQGQPHCTVPHHGKSAEAEFRGNRS